MFELINQVKRLLTLASGGVIPGQSSLEVVDQQPAAAPSHSRAEVSNGVRWSDIVAAIESERV